MQTSDGNAQHYYNYKNYRMITIPKTKIINKTGLNYN